MEDINELIEWTSLAVYTTRKLTRFSSKCAIRCSPATILLFSAGVTRAVALGAVILKSLLIEL